MSSLATRQGLATRRAEHGRVDVILLGPGAIGRQLLMQLARLALAHGGRILHEATVGAGLPVIDTARKLLQTGDRITRIEGCPSGTLGYLFGELGRGLPFSASLRRPRGRERDRQPVRLHDCTHRAQPLVIRGPGAGPTVTAAGVHNDLMHLAASAPNASAGLDPELPNLQCARWNSNLGPSC